MEESLEAFYPPLPPDASLSDIESEIPFLEITQSHLKPTDPTYERNNAYLDRTIAELYSRLENIAATGDAGHPQAAVAARAMANNPFPTSPSDGRGSSASSNFGSHSCFSSPVDTPEQDLNRKRSSASMGQEPERGSKRPSLTASPALSSGPATPGYAQPGRVQQAHGVSASSFPFRPQHPNNPNHQAARPYQPGASNHATAGDRGQAYFQNDIFGNQQALQNNRPIQPHFQQQAPSNYQNQFQPQGVGNGAGYQNQFPQQGFQNGVENQNQFPQQAFQNGAASQAQFRPQRSSNNIIDLTEDAPQGHGFAHTANIVDPFPELAAYRPSNDRSQYEKPSPADAFAQDAMADEVLARFLTQPGPAPAAVSAMLGEFNNEWAPVAQNNMAGQNAQSLEEELFGGSLNDLPESNVEVSTEITKFIESIKPDDITPPEQREKTPTAMASELMEHQKLGLAWLKRAEEGHNKGGILADEMGLGKTVQAISLIVARPSPDRICKTTLVVAPVALMRQWEKEIARHVKASHKLKVYIYHGAGKKADFDKLRQYDVVLTTFGTLSSEKKQIDTRQEAEREVAARGGVPRKAKDKLALLGPECHWYRIIIDEAQCIKNRATQTSKAAGDLQATYRLCMTGTPMMNSVDELYPLIRFLRIKPYNDWLKFNNSIAKSVKDARSRAGGMKRLQALLKGLMLRRQKDTIIDGKPLCQIPPKVVNKTNVNFSDSEWEVYKAIESKSQIQMNRYLDSGSVSANYASILVMLLRLRQACCHPRLIKDLSVQASTEGISEEDLLARAHDLKDEVVNRLLLIQSFECPICLDGAPNPTIFLPCGHNCCGECFQKLVDPSQVIRDGDEQHDPKCPSCRGPLSSKKITDFKHFCKAYDPEKAKELFDDEEVDSDADSDSDSDSDEEEDADVDDNGDLDGFVVPDDVDDDFEPAVHAAPSDHAETTASGTKRKKGKGKRPKKPKVTLADLKKESMRNKAAKKKYLSRLRRTWVPSAKIEKTLELLSEIRANDPTEKILIFSQFTSLLDLVEVPLDERGYKYQRYDGSMKMDDRADAVNKFMDDPEQSLMLVSLKAGNAGLNLNKASQVIILDPFWNPFIEDQAVDRAHRMPQQRVVHVHRLLVPDTVEDRIIALQDGKREIINAALDESAGQSISRLGVKELRYLFGLGGRPT